MSEDKKKASHQQLSDDLIERLRSGITPCGFEEYMRNRQGLSADARVNGNVQSLDLWCGAVTVKGVVRRNGHVRLVEGHDQKPDCYGVYAQKQDRTLQWLNDYGTEQEARDIAGRLTEIFVLLSGNDLNR
jgi:hypothetical protein